MGIGPRRVPPMHLQETINSPIDIRHKKKGNPFRINFFEQYITHLWSLFINDGCHRDFRSSSSSIVSYDILHWPNRKINHNFSVYSKPIQVEKLVPLDFDVNLLAAFDTNALEEKTLK